MKSQWFLIPLFCVFMVCGYAYQTTNEANKLKSISHKIYSLKKHLYIEKSKQMLLRTALRKTEITIGQLSKKIALTHRQLYRKRKWLRHAKQEQYQNERNLATQITLLRKQILAAYMLGRQAYFKILLNQEDPVKINRYLHYYHYLNQARLDNIKRIKYITEQIKVREKEIQKQTKTLKAIRYKLLLQKKTIYRKQAQRHHLLNHISASIKGKSRKLERLYANKKHLQKIIKLLYQQRISQYIYYGKTFAQMRGKLIWPVKGRVVQHFGRSFFAGRMHALGIIIKAREGEKVHAIFPGKVVFANWLNGFGLLVIIQHNNEYLSLYGRNQSLYVKTGEVVQANQIIATVGDSGGFRQDALYFEIRHKERPMNPLRWLKHV